MRGTIWDRDAQSAVHRSPRSDAEALTHPDFAIDPNANGDLAIDLPRVRQGHVGCHDGGRRDPVARACLDADGRQPHVGPWNKNHDEQEKNDCENDLQCDDEIDFGSLSV
jgi:hypothetical protein